MLDKFYLSLIIAFGLSFNCFAQVDPVWQAYYDSTDATWGVDWFKTDQLLTQAKKHLEKTLAHPEMDSTYNLTLNDLGICYQIMGRYAEALPLLLETLENTETSLGKDHSEYGGRLNSLGLLYLEMGRYSEALPLLLEALENKENTLGKDHSEYGRLLNQSCGIV